MTAVATKATVAVEALKLTLTLAGGIYVWGCAVDNFVAIFKTLT